MKKYISKLYVLLVFVVFAMMAVGCGKSDKTNRISETMDSSKETSGEKKSEKPDNIVPTEKAEPTESAKPTEKPVPTINPEPTEVLEEVEPLESVEPNIINDIEIIEETVLFDQDGIRVTAKEFAYDAYWRKGINLLIENATDKNIGMMNNTLVVNNYMVDDFFSCQIAPRTTVNETFPLSSPNISVIGINVISEVAISLHVFDNDSGDTLFLSEEVTIPTSEYGKVEQLAMEDGTQLWEQAGVRILGKYVDENSPWGSAVLLYIENTSEEDVLIQCDDLSMNGISEVPFFFCLVKKGRVALDGISIMNSDMENNSIQVKEIGLTLSIVDPASNSIVSQSGLLPLFVEE